MTNADFAMLADIARKMLPGLEEQTAPMLNGARLEVVGVVLRPAEDADDHDGWMLDAYFLPVGGPSVIGTAKIASALSFPADMPLDEVLAKLTVTP